MIIDTIREFFDAYDRIETRIKEIAPLCTNICPCEDIMGFSKDGDGDIRVMVWSRDCGNDFYNFPLQYLAMTNDEIVECEKKKKAEEARKRAEREARKEAREKKKRRERQERMEYERLKKKYEGGMK